MLVPFPGPQQDTVEERRQLDLPIDEVAQSLGVSPNTAKVRLFRARKAFIDAWQAREPAPRNPTPDAEEDHR